MARLDVSKSDECQKKLVLEQAADVRKFEITLFWQRSVFFWTFIGAAFVAYGVLATREDKNLPLAIACFGIVCSVAWTLANRGSKYWQEAWEQKVEAVQSDVLGCALFSHVEPLKDTGWWGASRYSVTRLAIALSDFTVGVWAFLAVKTLPIFDSIPTSCTPIALMGGTALYIVALFVGTRSRLPRETN